MYEIGVVHRNIERAEAGLADKLAAFGYRLRDHVVAELSS